MENNLFKLSSIEAIFIFVIVTINRIILNQPQKIISSMGSSAIINVIYISIIAIVFTLIIIRLFIRFANCDIIDISQYVGGNTFKTIIGFTISIYLVLIASLAIRNFSEILYLSYYNQTQILYLLLFFIILCFLANLLGSNSIIKTNVIITIIMFISLIITFYCVTDELVFQRALPTLGYGVYNTFFIGISNIISYNGLLGLYFIGPLITNKQDFKKISIISVIIIGILSIVSTTYILLTLSDNIGSISPLYALITHSKFGTFFQHPESIFIFTWIFSIISYLNIVVMFAIYFLKKSTGITKQNLFVLPICICILIISLIPQNLSKTLIIEDIIYKYISFPLIFILFPVILIIGNIKVKKKG